MSITIRKAEKKDVPAMLGLIKELALYEKALDQVTNTVGDMEKDGFGNQPIFSAYLAEVNNEVAGIAIYYIAYSTWKGKYIYLDDFIVNEDFRRYGIGKKLFEAVGYAAKMIGANQFRWHVLNWNEPAINFYKKYDASLDPEWITCKLTKEQIGELFTNTID
ncbi:MAG: GNAT family N-acetyltransferase [Chitinophagales bacterium]|nr:GNAT family N-acetyltransferase [Chitinophagales bacterium]